MNFYLLRRDESIHYVKKVKISPVFREFTEYQKSIPMDELIEWRDNNYNFFKTMQLLLMKELNLTTKLGMIDFSDKGNVDVMGYDVEKNIINTKFTGKFDNLISTMMYYKIIKDKDYCERDLISQEVGLKRFEMCLKHLKRGGNLMTHYFNFCYQGSLELIWLGLKLFEKVLFVDVVGERFYAIYMGFSPLIKKIELGEIGDNKEFMKWLENVFKSKIGYMKIKMEEYEIDNHSLIKTKSKNPYEWMEKYVNKKTFFYKTKLDGLRSSFKRDNLKELNIIYEKLGGSIFKSVVVKNINKEEGKIIRNLVRLWGYLIVEKWWNISGQEFCKIIQESGNWLEVETRNHFKIYRKISIGILSPG